MGFRKNGIEEKAAARGKEAEDGKEPEVEKEAEDGKKPEVEKEAETGEPAAWKRLLQYAPWLLLLFVVDVFSFFIIWVADIQAFQVMMPAMLLASFLLFAAVCTALLFREQGREKAFRAFLENPDEYHEELLRKAAGAAREASVHMLGNVLREREAVCGGLRTQLAEYEEYVEAWAHETKMPLSLLTFLLDNHREDLPESVVFKLDYVENRMGEFIEQMLFYARVKGTRKDYLFEYLAVEPCIEEVLEDYSPLLEEKRFRVMLPESGGTVYTDRRGFRFLLQQVVSNAVKYSSRDPELCFRFINGEHSCILSIRDNGTGVRACDLPYIFEKGFAGQAGEGRKDATGMGLYLAKEIAGDLGLSLEAVSEWGEGFEMRILFPVVRG